MSIGKKFFGFCNRFLTAFEMTEIFIYEKLTSVFGLPTSV